MNQSGQRVSHAFQRLDQWLKSTAEKEKFYRGKTMDQEETEITVTSR